MAGALHKPKGICLYAKVSYGYVKVGFFWTSDTIRIQLCLKYPSKKSSMNTLRAFPTSEQWKKGKNAIPSGIKFLMLNSNSSTHDYAHTNEFIIFIWNKSAFETTMISFFIWNNSDSH